MSSFSVRGCPFCIATMFVVWIDYNDVEGTINSFAGFVNFDGMQKNRQYFPYSIFELSFVIGEMTATAMKNEKSKMENVFSLARDLPAYDPMRRVPNVRCLRLP